ncbi:hypothetical protein [Pyxidicoccus fallax]|nr:hypothetical protein [Pyxidicoccus fallax]
MTTCLLGLAALTLASCSDDDKDIGCAQVVVYARPASGGECTAFPTPCDVPGGYVECCGGFLGGGCVGTGADARCVDDPTDSCDPASGGADCPGICQ